MKHRRATLHRIDPIHRANKTQHFKCDVSEIEQNKEMILFR